MSVERVMFCPACRKRTRFLKIEEGFEKMRPMCFWMCLECKLKLFSPDGLLPRSQR